MIKRLMIIYITNKFSSIENEENITTNSNH